MGLKTRSLRRPPQHPCHSCDYYPFSNGFLEDSPHLLGHLHSHPRLHLLQVCPIYLYQHGLLPCILRNLRPPRPHHRHPDHDFLSCLECSPPIPRRQLVCQQLSLRCVSLKVKGGPFRRKWGLHPHCDLPSIEHSFGGAWSNLETQKYH